MLRGKRPKIKLLKNRKRVFDKLGIFGSFIIKTNQKSHGSIILIEIFLIIMVLAFNNNNLIILIQNDFSIRVGLHLNKLEVLKFFWGGSKL